VPYNKQLASTLQLHRTTALGRDNFWMTKMHSRIFAVLSVALLTIPAAANTVFFFTTGKPDGQMATLSRVASTGKIQTETADDFILNQSTTLTQATFIGLIPTNSPLSSISQVEIEFYHVFRKDSGPFDNRVTTRD